MAIDKSEILVFNYAPKLKVAGTFHILTQRDRKTLEALVCESDFVALEWDEARNRGDFQICRHTARRGYDREKNVFYAGLFDSIYLRSILKLNRRRVKRSNETLGRSVYIEAVKGKEFKQENEFEFCYGLAMESGKDIYLVDPFHRMLSGLTGLSPGVKLCHLLSACMDSEMPEEVTLIKERQREINMIYGIVEREGPIHKLKRQGLLVVGCCHARNYMKSAML